jgi:hypothetical protein
MTEPAVRYDWDYDVPCENWWVTDALRPGHTMECDTVADLLNRLDRVAMEAHAVLLALDAHGIDAKELRAALETIYPTDPPHA